MSLEIPPVVSAQLAARYREVDWASTPLGDPAGWSEALRATLDLMLRTRFPATMLWGPEFVMLYNDTYIELIGDKHPTALGRRCRDVFPEAWDQIGPLMQGVVDTGESVLLPEALVPLDRGGFVEDCWFTFCYSPVAGVPAPAEAGVDRADEFVIEGVLDITVEITDQVLARRRLQVLTELTSALALADSRADVRRMAVEVLSAGHADLVEVDLWLPDTDGAAVSAGGTTEPPSRLRSLVEAAARAQDAGDAADAPEGSSLRTTEDERGTVVWQPVEGLVPPLERLDTLVDPAGLGSVAADLVGIGLAGADPASGGSTLAVRVAPGLPLDAAYCEFLGLVGSAITQTLTRVGAREVERALATADRQMSLTLQHALLSAPSPGDGVRVAARYVPSSRREQVGGDWHDAFRNAAGDLVVAIGDVSGHDRNAAAQMAQVRNLVRGLAYDSADDPARMLERLDALLADLAPDILATTVLARVTAPGPGEVGHTVVWANAGHPVPVLLQPDGAVDFVDDGHETLLGIGEGPVRRPRSTVVAPGSTLVLYTDGLVERRGRSMPESDELLLARLRGHHDDDPETIAQRLLELALAEGAADDVALLVLRLG